MPFRGLYPRAGCAWHWGAPDQASVVRSQQGQEREGGRVPAYSATGTEEPALRDVEEGDASPKAPAGVAALESWLLSTAQSANRPEAQGQVPRAVGERRPSWEASGPR